MVCPYGQVINIYNILFEDFQETTITDEMDEKLF